MTRSINCAYLLVADDVTELILLLAETLLRRNSKRGENDSSKRGDIWEKRGKRSASS